MATTSTTIKSCANYMSYGNDYDVSGTGESVYTDKPYDGATGLYYYGFRFTDDKFKDVLVIPITPSSMKESMEIRGSWKKGSLDSTLEINGIYLDWSLRPSGDEQRPRMLWIEGKYGPRRGESDWAVIASEKGDRDFRIQIQPSSLAVIIAHKKQLTSLALVNGLTQACILKSLIFGGRGLGSFKGIIMQGGGGFWTLRFDSEPFTF